MRFTCSRERLLDGLQMVGGVVSSRGMKPIYESVKIQSVDGSLQLHGTDLEVSIRYDLVDDQLSIEEPGAFAVPASRLTAIVREVKDEQISFTWADNTLSVKLPGSHFKMKGLSAEEFPEIPDFPAQATVTLPGKVFSRMVTRSAFATAKEKMRYALNGVLVLLENRRLQMVGTDGRRLAHAEAEVENEFSADIRVIVPTKGMTLIRRVLGDDEEVLDLAVTDNQLIVRSARSVVVSRLVEGTYPNFEEVIPSNCEKRVVLNREDFSAALRKVRLVTSKESQSVRFGFKDNELALSSRAAEVGEALVKMDVVYAEDAAEVAFNPGYLLEGLAVMEGDDVVFEFRNPTSPARLSDGDDFTYVVMPISIE